MTFWTIDDVPWHRFDRSLVDPDLCAVIKAAALVERNAADYVSYLHGVFADDAAFATAVDRWGEEETKHGDTLGRWASMADPDFDFMDSYGRFRAGYRIPVDAAASVRGSRSGELVARCVVESGTSSFYSALRDASREPVLKDICHRIAGEEFRHYKLFYDTLRCYRAVERQGAAGRLRVVAQRLFETGDDELAFAYHCANTPERPYDRRRAARDYAGRACAAYRRGHADRAARMMVKSTGLDPRGWTGRLVGAALWYHMRWRAGPYVYAA